MYSVLAFGGIGTQEIIVVLIIVVVLFGATKIPKLGSALGEGILNFKRGMRKVQEEDANNEKKDSESQTSEKKELTDETEKKAG